ncbi:MAG TPA: GH1 family beta-glucosidase [Pseudonocardia sp.]|uniref:GH1 family beta-glucosidase n=1 Tax=Pseudonocardia sp. TaxID=60912 RepID=UPI002B4B5E50|nr:GH1 family beta-glucosidase [Pseudonocardia sp.]HLU59364.1 GH1 family beta-glucosidase [Pseudonocardia sp.]
MTEPITFPDGFVWGTATAAYQIEGAATEDGRGASIWDTFSHTPGAVRDGDTGDVACDHYHRYREDVGLMRELGIGAYRFSLAWPRLQPQGRGPLHPGGVGFYDRLLDELHAAGIRPWVTLYHWDLPQALEDAGGWPERDTALRFAEYAAAVHERFADRIPDWTTLNEPWCSAFLGYASGVHAPGRRDPAASLRAAHHLLLGHGLAVEAMRSTRPDLRYGITLNLYPTVAASADPADAEAARRVDGQSNRLFLDPLLAGRYPADVLADLEPIAGTAHIRDGDEKQIAVPLDVLGVNYYTRHVVRGGKPDEDFERDASWVLAPDVEKVRTGAPRTEMGWEIHPDGLYDTLVRVSRDYDAPPLFVTENGAAFADVVDADGRVRDQQRIDFLDGHFRAAARAIADGVDLRGYFVWSLMDNFEWAWGYARRFGLVHVDYATQQRTPKDSARWFAGVARANGITG